MSQETNNPLDPQAVLTTLESVLLTDNLQTGGNASEIVILRSNQDALAALFHAIMQAVGFRLIGLEEDTNVHSTEDSEGYMINLPKEWNSQGPNSYSFRYKHPQSSFTFLVKCMRLANKFLVHGVGIEDNKTSTPTLEVISDDYTSPSIFPYTVEKQRSEPFVNVFISISRLKDLISLYKINIVQKLVPGLNKPGYEETSTTTSSNTRSSARQQPPIIDDPLRIPARRSPYYQYQPPIFYEPYGGDEPLPYNPLRIGQDDLDPLGFRPIIGPPSGPSRGGGMYVGPDHPIFDPRRPSGGEIYGGPQPLPRGAVPSGARFDPIGPFGPQPSRGRRRTGRGGVFSDPGFDELPPPGYNDMFM